MPSRALLATIPVLCMGLFAPRRRTSRAGSAPLRAWRCLAVLAVFGVARAVAPGALL